MEQNRHNQRPYTNEDDNWDQNQGRHRRENDYNQSRNFGDEHNNRGNEGWQNRSNYRGNQENQNDWNSSGNQFNQGGQGSGRRFEDDYGNNFRNQQNEEFNRNQNYDRGNFNQGGYGERGFNSGERSLGNRENDDQRNYGNSNRNRSQGNYGNSDNRDWFDRTRDEVSSWFGDDNAERRRRMDNQSRGQHRGKGPKQYQRSSERIREDVSDRLSDDSYVDASEIEIKVNGTEVLLSGSVDSKEAKRRAEDIAESVSGVTNVQNQLKVGQTSQSSSGNYQAKPQTITSQGLQDKDQRH